MEVIKSISYLGMIVMWVIAVINIFKMKGWSMGTRIGWVLFTILFSMITVIAFFFKAKKKRLAIVSIATTAVYVFSVAWKIWGV